MLCESDERPTVYEHRLYWRRSWHGPWRLRFRRCSVRAGVPVRHRWGLQEVVPRWNERLRRFDVRGPIVRRDQRRALRGLPVSVTQTTLVASSALLLAACALVGGISDDYHGPRTGAGGASGFGGFGGSSATGGAGGGTGATGGAGATGGGSGGVGGSSATGGTGGSSGAGATGGGTCTPPNGVGSCDTIPQCGCGATENCDIGMDGTTQCIPAGAIAPYHACSGGGCAKGFSCVVGNCMPFCDTPDSSCGTNAYSKCNGVRDSSGNSVPGYFVCAPVCDPTNPPRDDATYDACGPGLGCNSIPNGASFCIGPTNPAATQGASCSPTSLCAPGYLCDAQSLTCYRYCSAAAPACPGATTCTSFTPPQYAGPTEIGVCL